MGDLALLVVIGVNEEGFREVLAVESAAGEKREAYRNLLKGLLERGLTGVPRVIQVFSPMAKNRSDDHESIKGAVQIELPAARWQRWVVHFQRNVLCHIPATDMEEVASDLKGIFAVHRRESADALATAFAERYVKRFVKGVGVLKNGLANALTFLSFPSGHHRLLRTTNGLERLFGEVKRGTRVIGIFPNETSAANLCTAVRGKSLHCRCVAGDGRMGVEAVSGHGTAQCHERSRRGQKLTHKITDLILTSSTNVPTERSSRHTPKRYAVPRLAASSIRKIGGAPA